VSSGWYLLRGFNNAATLFFGDNLGRYSVLCPRWLQGDVLFELLQAEMLHPLPA
jgi:hypothetical protein